jgi:chaperonin GroES
VIACPTYSVIAFPIGPSSSTPKYGGTEITVEGEDLLILTSRDVLAKVAK